MDMTEETLEQKTYDANDMLRNASMKLRWVSNFILLSNGREISRIHFNARQYLHKHDIPINDNALRGCLKHYGLLEIPSPVLKYILLSFF